MEAGSYKTLRYKSPVKTAILEALRHGPKTIQELSTQTGCHLNPVTRYLYEFQDEGLVVAGRGRPRTWHLSAEVSVTKEAGLFVACFIPNHYAITKGN